MKDEVIQRTVGDTNDNHRWEYHDLDIATTFPHGIYPMLVQWNGENDGRAGVMINDVTVGPAQVVPKPAAIGVIVLPLVCSSAFRRFR